MKMKILCHENMLRVFCQMSPSKIAFKIKFFVYVYFIYFLLFWLFTFYLT